jgi:hypothetical protein
MSPPLCENQHFEQRAVWIILPGPGEEIDLHPLILETRKRDRRKIIGEKSCFKNFSSLPLHYRGN